MDWEIKEGVLTKDFEFKNFLETIDFVNKIAKVADKKNHHPYLIIHSYKKLKVKLFTHSENKVTDKDYSLAKEIDGLN